MTDAPTNTKLSDELSNPELNGLLKLSNREGVDIRPTLLRVITDLYLQKPDHSAQESQRYERLALKLIEHVDAKTKATIAQKIAGYPNAPASVRQRLLKEYIKIKTPEEQAQAALTQAAPAQPAKPAEHKPATAGKAAADELSELFFTANAEERRLILLNLPYAPITPAAPLEPATAKAVSQRLEAAALNHRIEAFARELEQSLSISRELAHRMVTDPSGEPIVVAAAALQMSAAVLQRILLCINPVISQSVQLVYDLALLHEELKAASALRMIAIWQAVHRPESNPGTRSKFAAPPIAPHEPQHQSEPRQVEQQPAARHAGEQRTVEQRRTAFSGVRPKILWDQHTKDRKIESA
jgi:hypothetical protein